LSRLVKIYFVEELDDDATGVETSSFNIPSSNSFTSFGQIPTNLITLPQAKSITHLGKTLCNKTWALAIVPTT